MSVELVEVLKELASSPVKKDNEAIQRIEKVSGNSIDVFIDQLENNAVLAQVTLDAEEKPKSKLLVICLNGCLFGAIIGLVSLVFKPEITVYAIPLGYTVGAAGRYIQEIDESKK
ncbi:MAG: hypothetical protein HWQ38_19070 [Nostoc sp. NMS7]|uniref:hypothetical protein n=1 Tax=Nostoc sp. NMS7 TaxID=2815391 RepID=UPI0026005C45|nr:hypothetical protein [Nostoc sp. NMS7]MBN3948438.1 hypothetical protein [Nostoc sp. NMS7]